jgi:hypothetical protein
MNRETRIVHCCFLTCDFRFFILDAYDNDWTGEILQDLHSPRSWNDDRIGDVPPVQYADLRVSASGLNVDDVSTNAKTTRSRTDVRSEDIRWKR